MIQYDSDNDLPAAKDAIAGLVHRVLALDGSCVLFHTRMLNELGFNVFTFVRAGTAENGVGPDTEDYLTEELGPNTVQLMRVIKKAVDPDNVLNPHKVIFLPIQYGFCLTFASLTDLVGVMWKPSCHKHMLVSFGQCSGFNESSLLFASACKQYVS